MKESPNEENSELEPYEVIRRVPGVDRDTLHRWRKQGYIRGRIRKVGKKPIFVYSIEEIPKIKRMSDLVKEGYSPHRAFERTCFELGLSTTENLDADHDSDSLAADWRNLFRESINETAQRLDLPHFADEPYDWNDCTKQVMIVVQPGNRTVIMASTHNDPPVVITISEEEDPSTLVKTVLDQLKKEFSNHASKEEVRKKNQLKNEGK